jgi:NTP pyrophosphatase (non-canonical NTP hydrolase)
MESPGQPTMSAGAHHGSEPMSDSIDDLNRRLREFARARDWEQFHSPKNLSMALIAEAAELVEHFQWLSEEQSQALPAQKLREVELELADIFIFLLRCADRLGVDLIRAANEKTDINERRFPVEQVRGRAMRGVDHEG